MHTTITSLFGAAQLAIQAPRGSQSDQTDLNNQQGTGGQQQQGQQQMPPEVSAAPYVTLLTKLGYEYQGSDEDMGGGQIGSSFQGPDGDMIMVKPDGSWARFGPGAQRSQGKSSMDLGTSLVKDSLSQGDDSSHHAALRQAGYQKIHKDKDGNTYYKHPQTGKTVTVQKNGQWGSSSGTGRGAGKLREFLGNESLENQDPAMMQTKLKQQQMKQQMTQGGGSAGGGRQTNGTRGGNGTRAGARFGGRGGF